MRDGTLRGNRVGTILVAALAVLLMVTACAPAPTVPAQEEKVVEIGVLEPLSGAAGTAVQPAFQAMRDYVQYSNENNAIPGVTLKIVWYDTATASAGVDVPAFISGYQRLVDRGVPFIQSGSNTGEEALKPQFERDQMPVFSHSVQKMMVDPPGWIFSFWCLEEEYCAAMLDYFLQDWHEERPPKLQFFVLDSVFGYSVAEQATPYAQSLGYEVLPRESAPFVVLDASTQLTRIKEREADLVWLQHLVMGVAPILRDVERLGLQGKIQFAGTRLSMGEQVFPLAKGGSVGYISPFTAPWINETDMPGVKRMLDTEMKYRGEIYRGMEYTYGWIYAHAWVEALKRAIEEVGYENLNGPAVARALDTFNEFDADGLAKFTWGPGDRRGCEKYAFYQMQNDGNMVRISDWQMAPRLEG